MAGLVNGAQGGGIQGEEKKEFLLSCLSKGVSGGILYRDNSGGEPFSVSMGSLVLELPAWSG